MASTSSTSSTDFTGSSSYSADLQNAISRAIGFASLPLQSLQNQQNSLTNQQSEIQTLTTKFSALQSAIDTLGSAVRSGAYSASTSNTGVVTAYASAGAKAGTYSLEVISTGSHTNTMSINGLTTVTDPASGSISSATDYTLTVDGASYQISNTGGTLSSLVDAINSSSANVQATVVNLGSPSAPDYRLSIQGTKLANTAIQLSDGTTSLLTTVSNGSNVSYKVNGQATAVNSDTRSIALSTGLTVNILQTGSTDITVAQSATQMSSAFTAFAAAYNNAVDEIGKSRGQNGGALSGQSIIYTLSSSLRSLMNAGVKSGGISSLSDLGLTFDENGHLNFDSSVFSQVSSNSTAGVMTFLGSETGGGFLESASNILKSANDSTRVPLPKPIDLLQHHSRIWRRRFPIRPRLSALSKRL